MLFQRTPSKSLLALAILVGLSGCCCGVPKSQYRMSQINAARLHEQGQMLAGQLNEAQQLANQMAMDRQQLEQANADMANRLNLANQRVDNLMAERENVHGKYRDLLASTGQNGNPLSNDASRRLEELARRFPGFEFDPKTGVSRFDETILFDSGSDVLRQDSANLLREFSNIMNDNEARRLNILVVGHTDDQPINKGPTRAKHPTNWHLSTNRANSVVLQLTKLGINDTRLGSAGYSMYQPVAANSDGRGRQQNRRVEIFVLAPDAAVAGWDPATSRR